MSKKTKYFSARVMAPVALAVAMLVGAGSAQARPVQETGSLLQNTIGMRSDLRSNLGQIIAWLRTINDNITGLKTTVHMSGESTNKSAAEVGQMQADNVTRTAMQQEKMQAVSRHQLTDACGITAVSNGVEETALYTAMGGVVRGGGGGGAGGVAEINKDFGNLHPDLLAVLKVYNQTDAPPSVEVQAAKTTKGVCNTFVNGGLRKHMCDAGGLGSSASSGYPDADVRAETLLDGPQKSADVSKTKRRLTVSGNGNDRAAVVAYMRNLHTPLELRQLRKDELNTDAGRQFMVLRDAYEARMSMALRPSSEWSASTTERKDLVPVLEQMIQGESYGEYVRQELAETYPQWKSRGVSLRHVLYLEANKRYLNKSWHIFMAGQGTDGHIREQTNMMAQNIYLQTAILEELQKLNLQMGQSSSVAIRQELMPQLVQLHEKAAR